MAVVELLLSSLSAHVRTARLVVVAAARRAGLEDHLVDELRFAVGEAVSRAVGLHRRHAPNELVRIRIEDGASGLVVTVVDVGPAARPFGTGEPADLLAGLLAGSDLGGGAEEVLDPDLSLALLTGLVEKITTETGLRGTTVTMRWPLVQPSRGPGATVLSPY